MGIAQHLHFPSKPLFGCRRLLALVEQLLVQYRFLRTDATVATPFTRMGLPHSSQIFGLVWYASMACCRLRMPLAFPAMLDILISFECDFDSITYGSAQVFYGGKSSWILTNC